MTEPMSLANQLLIAMPTINQVAFFHSLIYVCEHHAEGAVGLIINRPMRYSLQLLFDQLQMPTFSQQRKDEPLLFGGPLQPERGFVLHRPMGHWQSSLLMASDEVTITTSNDIIRAIANDQGPKEAMVALGYVAWPDQKLEQEIMHNDWLVCPFKAELLYDVPFDDRWNQAALSLGVNMNHLVLGEGHA